MMLAAKLILKHVILNCVCPVCVMSLYHHREGGLTKLRLKRTYSVLLLHLTR